VEKHGELPYCHQVVNLHGQMMINQPIVLNRLSKIAKGVFDSVGIDIVLAYAAFAVVALFFNIMTGSGMYAALSGGMAATINGFQNSQYLSNGGVGL
jgi:hypothetical protein